MDTINQIQENTAGRPPANINNGLDTVFTKIQPFLKMGYSFHKACLYAEIPYTTYKKYYDENEDFRNKITRERGQISLIARRNIIKKIEEGEIKESIKWLETFDKDDFNKEPPENTESNDQLWRAWRRKAEQFAEEAGYTVMTNKQGENIYYKPPSWFRNPDTEQLEGEEEIKQNDNQPRQVHTSVEATTG